MVPKAAALPAGFQEFYAPLPADLSRAVFVNIDNDPVPSTGMHYVVGVTASANNTTVYYDHWENGYTTGATGDVVVTLSKGQVYSFESSNVPTSPRGTATYFDGGDRIYVAGSLLQLVVSIWPETPGTVFTDAWEVYPRQAWDTQYVVPVGEDLAGTPNNYKDFTKVWLLVQSGSDGNTITITDPKGAGLSTTLNRGKTATYEVKGAGTTVSGSGKVQVQLMTGKFNSGTSSEMRGYTLTPRSYWSNQYVAPVPGWASANMDLFLYNPNAATITMNYTDRTGSGSFTIGAGQTRSYRNGSGRYVPAGSGVSLQSSSNFWGIAAADTGSPTWDWGYDLIPTNFLGTDNYVSWAPGTENLSANGSPVYVTALNNNTVVFVDYGPNDGVIDATYTLSKLQAIQVFDPDKNNTGMHIISTNVVAVAWGESPDVAGTGTPFLDMGYTTLPLPAEWIEVALQVDKTANPTAINVGQETEFTVVVNVPATAGAPATGVNVVDTLPPGWQYVTGSGVPSEPTVSGNINTGYKLTWNVGWTISPGGSQTIRFRAKPTSTADTTVPNRNVAAATGVSAGATLTADDDAFVTIQTAPAISAAKTFALYNDADGNTVPSPGDTLEYTVQIVNSGNADATGVLFSDVVDPNTTLVVGSVSTTQGTVTRGNTAGDASVEVNVGAVAKSGGTVTIKFRVTIINPLPAGVMRVTNQGLVSGGNFASTPTDDPTLGGASDPTITPVTAAPRLTASKTASLSADVDGNGVPSPGDVLLYQVAIVNIGNVAASGVLFDDSPDANTTLLVGSVSTTRGTVTTGNGTGDTKVTVNVGSIPGGGSNALISFLVTINNPLPAGVVQVSNQGLVTSNELPALLTDDPAGPGPTDRTVTPVTAAPRISATKTDLLFVDADGNSAPSPGDTLKYVITIRNTGNAAGTITYLDDIISTNTTLVVGSVQASQGTITQGNTSGDTGVQVDVGTIAGGGGSATVSFDVTIHNPLPAGVTQVANQGIITGTNFPAVVTDDPDTVVTGDATVTTVTATPMLVATKRDVLFADADSNDVPSPGDTLLYRVTILNGGNAAASNVAFQDTPDSNTSLVVGSVATNRGTVTTGNVAGDTSVQVDVGALPGGGAFATISFQVTINSPLPAGVLQVANQGLVSSTEVPSFLTDDPDTAQGGDATLTPVTAAPIIAATKTDLLLVDADDNGLPSPGDTLKYLVVIENLGNAAATGIAFSDAPDSNTTLVVGSVQTSQGTVTAGNNSGDTNVSVAVGTIPGAHSSVSISFQVTVNDPLPGGVATVSNQGSVNGTNMLTVVTDDPDTPFSGDPTITPVTASPLLLATKTDVLVVDADGDGAPSPGDTLEYLITIQNIGHAAAATVVFSDTPDANTSLVVGSVTTSQGTITSGNAGTPPVTIGIGSIPGSGGSASISFQVTINSPLVGVSQVANQGTVTGSNFGAQNTDDPGTSATDDATVTNLSGTVSGVVFNDLNGNGVQDAGEAGIGGVTVQLVDSTGLVVGTTTTAGDGSYLFTGVTAGAYTVREIDPAGFVSTTPNGVAVTVPAGGFATANFGDRRTPTAVELAYFRVQPAEDRITVEWETETEISVLGFNIYRATSPDGPPTQLNNSLIPGQLPGSHLGAVYTYRDETVAPDTTYYYWLEIVNLSGGTKRHGPESATLQPHGLHHLYLPLVNR